MLTNASKKKPVGQSEGVMSVISKEGSGGDEWCVGAGECNGVRCNSDGDELDSV